MEAWTHTSEGLLVQDNPYLVLGTRGIHSSLTWGFVITQECIERGEPYANELYFSGCWIQKSAYNNEWALYTGRAEDLVKESYRIVTPENADYPLVKGIDF